ncbi:MAG: DnaJ domain-containing protein, partial [Fimbriimonadaceae bacterium]|nr:DnaJ domain-containing protein [Alphaproteobacteria bacterium]
MSYFLLGVLIVAIGAFLLRQLATANVVTLARNIRRFGAIILVLAVLLLAVMGRWVFSVPLLALAFGLIRRQLPGFGGFSGQRKSPGQTSTVRSVHLEMHLNHDSGDMDGEILTGDLAGRRLSSLSLGDLLDFVDEVVGDEESVSLMDAYLDRRFLGWREDDEDEEADGDRRGPMSRDEALSILGLTSGASVAQIKSAHRKLMKKLHPDQGGSTYFATKLN